MAAAGVTTAFKVADGVATTWAATGVVVTDTVVAGVTATVLTAGAGSAKGDAPTSWPAVRH